MKINMPVTQREVELRDTLEIVSKTDLQGQFTFINSHFLASIDGLTRYSLVMPKITEKSIANAINLVRKI